MNENLQNAVASIITKAVQGADAAAEFVKAELPDVIQQLLTWNLVENLVFWCASVFLLLVVAPVLIRMIFVAFKNCDNDESKDHWAYSDEVACPVAATSFVLSLISIIVGLIGICDIEWLQIWLAPKVWLIEYAADLVK